MIKTRAPRRDPETSALAKSPQVGPGEMSSLGPIRRGDDADITVIPDTQASHLPEHWKYVFAERQVPEEERQQWLHPRVTLDADLKPSVNAHQAGVDIRKKDFECALLRSPNTAPWTSCTPQRPW